MLSNTFQRNIQSHTSAQFNLKNRTLLLQNKSNSAHVPMVRVCRYSVHILTVMIASYLIIVHADINNVHK